MPSSLSLTDRDWKLSVPAIEAQLLSGGPVSLKDEATAWGVDLSISVHAHVLELRGFSRVPEEKIDRARAIEEMNKVQIAVREFLSEMSKFNGIFSEMGRQVGLFSCYGMGSFKICELNPRNEIGWSHPWYMEGGKYHAAS